jgi:hypothetical protein
MSTFEHDAVIVTLASRASDQVRSGLKELHAGNLLAAEVFLNAAAATMQSLVVLLETPQPVKPFRRLVVVGTAAAPHDPELLPWMETTHGDDPDAA